VDHLRATSPGLMLEIAVGAATSHCAMPGLPSAGYLLRED
jgi:hypothetical protein